MGILTVSDERLRKLQCFRRATWKAIALFAALRLTDTAFGLGLIEPTSSLTRQEMKACHIEQEFTP